MTCPDCGFETKVWRVAKSEIDHLIGTRYKEICRTCWRKASGKPWRWFRLLQVLGWY